MQFIDLKVQYESLKSEIDNKIQSVLNESQFILGSDVAELEAVLQSYIGVKHAITCANGTDALSLALMALDVKQGDAIFVPTFTFFSTAETVSLRGASPIFVDIETDTYNMSASALKSSIIRVLGDSTLKPKAIIAVDLFGLPADYSEMRKIADEFDLQLIEDGAQGFGGAINEKKACSFGDISTTSFFPAKPLGCYGDGGAVFTDNDELNQIVLSLRNHGKGIDKYDNVRIGLNSRLDTLQAAVLLVKFDAFRKYELDNRNIIANRYSEGLKGVVQAPVIPNGYVSSFAQYSILLDSEDQRDYIQRRLNEQAIPTMVYYKKSMHQQSVYKNNPSSSWEFPVAEDISKRILNIPMHPYLSTEEQDMIIHAIQRGVAER